MLRPKLLAMLTTALALLGGALLLAPIGATQSALPRLSQTPPVTLAPPSSSATTGTATTSGPANQLPRTGFNTWPVVLLGLGLLGTGGALRRATGAALRRGLARPASSRSG